MPQGVMPDGPHSERPRTAAEIPSGMEHFVKVDKEGRRIKLLVEPAPPVNNWVAWRSTQNLFFILYFVNEAWDLELEIEAGDRQSHEIMQRK